MKTITNITYPAFALCALACFALSPRARAVCQEGCLTNFNTALGEDALISNTTGRFNTAVGFLGLYANTTGNFNTATGLSALQNNTTGGFNTAAGLEVLYSNTAGYNNTATGFQALYSNTTGNNNTADGLNALGSNTTGSFNIALGHSAGINLTTGDGNIDIGNRGVAGESNTIRIGRSEPHAHTSTYIAGISRATVAAGVAVMIEADGHLGTMVSSQRFRIR